MNSYIATIHRRIFAKLIDYFLIGMITSLFAVQFSLSGVEDAVYISLSTYLMIIFAIPFLYSFTFLVLTQQTPGKWLMQIKVVPIGQLGKDIDVAQVFLRSLSEHLLGFIGIAYFIPVLWRYDRRHWGDLFSDTVVVQIPPRERKTKIYPLTGLFLFFIFIIPAMESFSNVFDRVDWGNRRIVVEQSNIFDELFQLEEDVLSD